MTSSHLAATGSILLLPWVIGPAVFVTWIVLLPIIKRAVLAIFRRRLAARPQLEWANAMVAAMSPAITLLIWVTGVAVLLRIMPIGTGWRREIAVGLDAGIVIAVIVFFDRWAPALLRRLTSGSPAVEGEYGLIRGVTRVVIISLGMLMFLDTVGVSITPILASLGVGTVAVALALQDTLTNLFAGIYIAADQPILPGDFLRLDTGQEGYLTRLGWRSSLIRTLPEGTIVVPNSKLTQSVLINYTLPNRDSALAIELTVAAAADLDRVEVVTLEVAREALRATSSNSASDAGATAQPEPTVRFQAFAGATVKLTVGMRSSADAAAVRHEFIKRLRARYQRENIALA
jgi:small-conductance mechanosensitive channel